MVIYVKWVPFTIKITQSKVLIAELITVFICKGLEADQCGIVASG